MNSQGYRFLRGGPTNWGYVLVLMILTILVAGAILGYSKYVFEEMTPLSKLPEITISKKIKDETANWKTYRNEEYKYIVKYPKDSDWEITNEINPLIFGSESCIWIQVAENPKNLSVEKYYEEFYKDYTDEECKRSICDCFRHKTGYKEVILPNITEKKAFQCGIIPGRVASSATLLSANNFIYGIWRVEDDYEFYKGPCALLNTSKIYNQMLSTFLLY